MFDILYSFTISPDTNAQTYTINNTSTFAYTGPAILINSFNGRILKSNGKKLLGLESALIESVKKALISRRDLILYCIQDL